MKKHPSMDEDAEEFAFIREEKKKLNFARDYMAEICSDCFLPETKETLIGHQSAKWEYICPKGTFQVKASYPGQIKKLKKCEICGKETNDGYDVHRIIVPWVTLV